MEGSYYLRDERDGILIGPYEKFSSVMLSPQQWRTEGIPKENS